MLHKLFSLRNLCIALFLIIIFSKSVHADVYIPQPPLTQTLLNSAPLIFIQLLLTLVIELPIYYIFGFRKLRGIGAVVVANIISVISFDSLLIFSNPFPHRINNFIFLILFFELSVIIFEALFLSAVAKLNMKRTILASIIANVTSALLGMTILYFTPILFSLLAPRKPLPPLE